MLGLDTELCNIEGFPGTYIGGNFVSIELIRGVGACVFHGTFYR